MWNWTLATLLPRGEPGACGAKPIAVLPGAIVPVLSARAGRAASAFLPEPRRGKQPRLTMPASSQSRNSKTSVCVRLSKTKICSLPLFMLRLEEVPVHGFTVDPFGESACEGPLPTILELSRFLSDLAVKDLCSIRTI